MGTAAAAEGTDSPVTEPAARQIHIKINVFCVDDSNEAIPQPGVTVEVRRDLYSPYYGENDPLPEWSNGLVMFTGTSDASGVVNIDAPYTVVKDPDDNAYDTAYLGDGRDNNHVILQRKADNQGYPIRFTIEPAGNSGYELNDVSKTIRNWKEGTNVTQIDTVCDENVYYDDFAFTSGILDGNGQENVGAYVQFDLYVKNMKPLLGAMVRNSELIICNRCDDVEDLEGYRRTLLAMNNQAEIVFEDAEGEISEISEADLPYDLSADVTVIAPEDFGIWYIDCMDKPDRYRGKVVEFTGMVMKSNKFPKNYFVPGRMAMTCCADDTAFIGFLCKSAYVDRIKSKQWLTVTAKAHIEKRAEYSGQEGLVLQSTNIKSAEKPEEELVYF